MIYSCSCRDVWQMSEERVITSANSKGNNKHVVMLNPITFIMVASVSRLSDIWVIS